MHRLPVFAVLLTLIGTPLVLLAQEGEGRSTIAPAERPAEPGSVQTTITDSSRIVELFARQFEVFNAQDLEAYVAMFTDDIEVFIFPDQLVQSGKEGFRDVYVGLFANYPTLTATPTIVTIHGNFVLYTEIIENAPGPTGRMQETAMLEYEGDLVRRFWFFPPKPIQ